MTAQHAPGMWRIHLRRRKKNCITQQIFGCESDIVIVSLQSTKFPAQGVSRKTGAGTA